MSFRRIAIAVEVDDFGTVFQRWECEVVPEIGDRVFIDTKMTGNYFDPLSITGRQFHQPTGWLIFDTEGISLEGLMDGDESIGGRDVCDVFLKSMIDSPVWWEHWLEIPE